MTRFCMIMLLVVLLGLITGCSTQPPRDTRAEDENVIREMETEGWKTIEAKDLEGVISYFADDALALYPNMPVIKGKDAIREAWTTMFAQPGFEMSGQPSKVEVSRAGDLAYVQGTYSQTMNDTTGKPVTDSGKYVVVYKKQPEGKWKLVIDMSNSDLPLAVPSKKNK